jgi:hypothetical protein
MPADTPLPPCLNKGELFFASSSELAYVKYPKDPKKQPPHPEALALCAVCHTSTRLVCKADGLRFKDKHTIRLGLRLWLPDERNQLKDTT